MKLAFFPNRPFLRVAFLTGCFFASIQIFYSSQPFISDFSEAYRWKDFERFVRMWIVVFWIFLLIAFGMEMVQKKTDKKEFGDSRFDFYVIRMFIPLILIGMYGIGSNLGKTNTIMDLLKSSINSFLFIAGGLAGFSLMLLLRNIRIKKNTYQGSGSNS